MKKSTFALIAITIISFLLSLSLTVIAFAHPGRTDANGGHWDHSTGEYHYHGKPNSSNSSGSSSSSSSGTSKSYGNNGLNATQIILIISFGAFLVAIFVVFPLYGVISDKIHSLKESKSTSSDKPTASQSITALDPTTSEVNTPPYSEEDYPRVMLSYTRLDEENYTYQISQDAIKAFRRLKKDEPETFYRILKTTSPKEWALRQLTYRILVELKRKTAPKYYVLERKKHLKQLYIIYLTQALEEGYIDKELYDKRVNQLSEYIS